VKRNVRRSLLAALALALGCSKPEPPTLSPDSVAVTRIDMAGIALDLALSATNPNSVDIVADDVTSHLVVGRTHDVGTITLPKSITLPAGKTTRLQVPVALKWNDMGVLAQLATTSGTVPYSVEGTLEMGGSLLHVGVPFHVDGTLSREQIVGAMMNSIPR
jgi:hypothetical protein